VAQHGGLRRALIAQPYPHAREQLLEAKRLGQVVVCPQLQAADLVDHVVAGAEDEHGHVLAAGAQVTQDLQAIHAR
jgi:hypothetical protein